MNTGIDVLRLTAAVHVGANDSRCDGPLLCDLCFGYNRPSNSADGLEIQLIVLYRSGCSRDGVYTTPNP